jgi:hypothetical protein
MSSIFEASTIDRYVSAKMALWLLRNRQTAHGERDLSIGKLSPALDDSQMAALRNAAENVTDLETRRLQRQRECLHCEVFVFSLATIALEARPVSEISRPFHETYCPLFRWCPDWRLARFRFLPFIRIQDYPRERVEQHMLLVEGA